MFYSILSHSILGDRGGEGLWRWWAHPQSPHKTLEGTQIAAAPGEPSYVSPEGPGALGSRDHTLFTRYPPWLLEETPNSQNQQTLENGRQSKLEVQGTKAQLPV